jgi:hypothetical protein
MVYLFLNNESGNVKIGHSNNIPSRMKSVSFTTGAELTLLGCILGERDEEKKLHDLFKLYRLQGEWFFPHGSILDYFKDTCTDLYSFKEGILYNTTKDLCYNFIFDQTVINIIGLTPRPLLELMDKLKKLIKKSQVLKIETVIDGKEYKYIMLNPNLARKRKTIDKTCLAYFSKLGNNPEPCNK